MNIFSNLKTIQRLCLITTFVTGGALFAMEHPDKSEMESGAFVIKKQKEDSKDLFTDSVISNKAFQDLYKKYLDTNPIEQAGEVSILEEQMLRIYLSYREQCEKEGLMPFIPGGTLGFLATGLDLPGSRFSNPLKSMDRLPFDYKLEGPSPVFELSELYKMIHEILISKYKGASDNNWKKTELNLETEEKREVLKFLLDYGKYIDIIGDPDLLVIAIRMLTSPPLIRERYSQSWEIQNLISSVNNCMDGCVMTLGDGMAYLLNSCAYIKNKKVIIKLDEWYNQILDSMNQSYLSSEEQKEEKERIKKQFISAMNKLFNVNGKQIYLIENDAKVLSENLAMWFNILHKLSFFEKREWEEKAERLNKFIGEANYAVEQLGQQNNNTMYSGVAEGPYTLLLIQTGRKDKKEDTEFLQKVVESRMKAHEKEVENHLRIKPFATVLKQTVSWLDELMESLKKNGRVS